MAELERSNGCPRRLVGYAPGQAPGLDEIIHDVRKIHSLISDTYIAQSPSAVPRRTRTGGAARPRIPMVGPQGAGRRLGLCMRRDQGNPSVTGGRDIGATETFAAGSGLEDPTSDRCENSRLHTFGIKATLASAQPALALWLGLLGPIRSTIRNGGFEGRSAGGGGEALTGDSAKTVMDAFGVPRTRSVWL
jgi:hypothetical protein